MLFRLKKNISEKQVGAFGFLQVDMHSHLLAGIDDGVTTETQAQNIIEDFRSLGYQKIITTPHIMSDFYKNTPEIIQKKLADLQNHLAQNKVNISVEAAAEYYLDENFLKLLQNKSPILCFGVKKYVLFETGFINYPSFVEEAIFLMKANSYTPVLAHPERYKYVQEDFRFVEKMLELGVLLQVNMLSLAAYYSREAQKIAQKLIDARLPHFLASDCHHERHSKHLIALQTNSYYKKLMNIDWLNKELV
ncbi:MAG: capsular polysaccharide biosynthesis protein [Raineya sp.]